MSNEVTQAADATAKPASEKVETPAPAAAVADAKVETKVESAGAETTSQASTHDQSGAIIAPSDKPEDKPVAPEKYELKLSKDSPLDASEVAKIESLAKAKGLSNEQAQEHLTEREEVVRSAFARQHAAQQESIKQMHLGWEAEIAADKEFGGEKLKETAEHAKRFVDRFGNENLRKALNDKVMRWGDNPTLLRIFASAGRSMANDKLVTEGKAGATSAKESRANRMYPTHNKEE